ncbi:MAG: phosphoribosylaminoimidazolesuccinocarboxamide synthase [Arenicellales bacterium WSBS_2016_MAG_OTU3]
MKRGEELCSGKAKSVYKTGKDDQLALHFRDDTSALTV